MPKKEVNDTEVMEAKANLDLVKSGTRPNDIEAAGSGLEGLQQLVLDQELLKRTSLVMPADDRLIAPDLHFKKGQCLNKGICSRLPRTIARFASRSLSQSPISPKFKSEGRHG